jgi:quinol-cytochrome oxidoreductase complex cytochrome b subunit
MGGRSPHFGQVATHLAGLGWPNSPHGVVQPPQSRKKKIESHPFICFFFSKIFFVILLFLIFFFVILKIFILYCAMCQE